jgi:hypothetical protein
MSNQIAFRIAGMVTLIAGCAVMQPAVAQMAGGGAGAGSPMGMGGPMGGGLHARQAPQEVAPPALPGASGVGNISAGPVTTTDEDPTKLLFTAINHGDYTQARAAVSRGANLNARNALNETPIELAVELNRNNITFMLLSVRAEEGQSPASQGSPSSTGRAIAASTHDEHRPVASPRQPVVSYETQQNHVQPGATLPDQHGVPNPSAGFLGFGGHS